MKEIFNQRVGSLFTGGLVALSCGAAVITAQTVAPETFTALRRRPNQDLPAARDQGFAALSSRRSPTHAG